MRGISVKITYFLVAAAVFLMGGQSFAAIDGVTGTTFNLTAKEGRISTADGGSYLMWGYALDPGDMQYPGPTMIVNQGATITVNLSNTLSVPVSIVFPGHTVTATGGVPGLMTNEAPPGGTVSYSFTASEPGTYTYYSGTNPALQVEMGLVGAIIVRPTGFNETTNKIAYNHADSTYDREFLFLLTEMDPRIHDHVEFGRMDQIDNTTYWPVYWFINGRTAPDTMAPAFSPLLPTQPYSAMVTIHPGDRVLLREIGGGRDMHPFHTHGNHVRVIARDGRLLTSNPNNANLGPDISERFFSNTVVPGETYDGIFIWTGARLGWDIYGHQADVDNPPTGNFPGVEDIDNNNNGIQDPLPPAEPGEDLTDHGKPFPVQLPGLQDLTFLEFYSGSPFLGQKKPMPPGGGIQNMNGGYFFMWHSHSEKELTNNDIFPGGLFTMIIVEHPSVNIDMMP